MVIINEDYMNNKDNICFLPPSTWISLNKSWVPNLFPLQEQPTVLIAEPFLHPLQCSFFKWHLSLSLELTILARLID